MPSRLTGGTADRIPLSKTRNPYFLYCFSATYLSHSDYKYRPFALPALTIFITKNVTIGVNDSKLIECAHDKVFEPRYVSPMKISLIWAMADNRVIGIENRLPWKLPADMQWFRQNTLGKAIIMGRMTFESFGAKPLPGRRNILVSRNNDYQAEGVEVFTSLEAALTAANDMEEVMVIGGMSIYQQALKRADRLYMTLVHAEVEGDAWFPQFDPQPWQEVERHDHDADEKNPFPYSFVIMERRQGTSD